MFHSNCHLKHCFYSGIFARMYTVPTLLPMKRLILILLLFQPFLSNGQSNDFNRVVNGRVGISISYQDSLISVGSNDLFVFINNVTREITIRLDPSTLKTGIDSLDAKLRSGFSQEVVFRGLIRMDNIWDKSTWGQSFAVEGELTINHFTQNVSLFGSLKESQQGMGIGALLYLHFDPELKDYGLDEVLPDFSGIGCVEMLQPITISNDRH